MLRLYDTLAGEVVPLRTRDPSKVTMYVCGPTVYGPPHLGHGRFALVFDVLRRYLEWSGFEVTYVSNITDVDDNIIDRARAEERTEAEVAQDYERVWYEQMSAMGVAKPTHDPHATDFIDRMIDLIDELVHSGAAYTTDAGVYLDVEAVEGYGALARQDLESLRAGARIDVDAKKRSPVDFALWKLADDDETLSWESPWGRGRPGWHTECVVMSLDLLGEGFDIHGGGQDLAFPHHENERAQATAAGRQFASHWMHNGWVVVGGEKMSKSLGNFTNLAELLETSDSRSYRLLILRSHYRSPIEVSPKTAKDAAAGLERLDAVARRAAALLDCDPDPEALGRFSERMNDDLDTPGAVELMFGTARRVNSLMDAHDDDTAAPLAAALMSMARAVGLELASSSGAVPDEVQKLLAARDKARADGDYELADRIRAELQSEGWRVKDTAGGTEVRRVGSR